MKEIAILGPTASGKSALAIEVAKEVNANILSLDSLAIYKEVDIVSAKPSKEEREGISHFGLDLFCVNEYFSAATFFTLYKEAKRQSQQEGKHLIIVGGTSFYLKALLEGLSPKCTPSPLNQQKVTDTMRNLPKAYGLIEKNDPLYAAKIKAQDRYRIQKWLEIFFESGKSATRFFEEEQKKAPISSLPIFDIAIDRQKLRKRIKERTSLMIHKGLIEEVFFLEKKYGRLPNPLKAIGIKESLEYLDGKIDLDTLYEEIVTHTAQLAKRQETFNNSQFPQREKGLIYNLKKKIISNFL